MSTKQNLDAFLAELDNVLTEQAHKTPATDETRQHETPPAATVPDNTRHHDETPETTGPGRILTLHRPLQGPRSIDELADTPLTDTPRQRGTGTEQGETPRHNTAKEKKPTTTPPQPSAPEKEPSNTPEETKEDPTEQDTKPRFARTKKAVQDTLGDGPSKSAEAIAKAIHERGRKSLTKDNGDAETRLRSRWAAVTTERAGRIRWAGILFTGSAALAGWHIGLTSQVSNILATAEAEIPSDGGHYVIAAVIAASSWAIDRAVSNKILPLSWLGRVALSSTVIAIALTI